MGKKQAEDKEGLGGKLSESDKEKILEVVEENLTWLRENGDDAAAEELKTQKKELEKVSQPIIAGVYKQEGDKSTAEGTLLMTSCRHLAPGRVHPAKKPYFTVISCLIVIK